MSKLKQIRRLIEKDQHKMAQKQKEIRELRDELQQTKADELQRQEGDVQEMDRLKGEVNARVLELAAKDDVIQELRDDKLRLMDEQKEQSLKVQQLMDEMRELKLRNLNPANFEEWSTEELVTWITALDPQFAQYKQEMLRVMIEEGVDGTCVDADISRGDIKVWGVKSFKHGKIIEKALHGLVQAKTNESEAKPATPYMPSEGAAEHTAYI